ncbi:MAG TPA: serine hydrolase domain-containing protein [Roseiflexaceae bacterium]|nr:serine hydrolase domain-containing protein [Roseiflexaceae bacterium]
MIFSRIVLAIVLVAATTPLPSSTNTVSPLDTGAIDRFLAAQLAAQRVPGLALAIVHYEDVVYLNGYGAAGDGQPVTPQTQFFIASLSKSITALAVMQLAEAGAIDLDAPVRRYLPEFTLADPDHAALITIRQLLHQVGGLADAGFPESLLPQPASLSERVAGLQHAQPVAAPGVEFHYFNPNYQLLARVVEVISGQPFSSYLQTHIFAPLQMKDTFNAGTTAEGMRRAERLAQGHLVVFGQPIAVRELDGFLSGEGGVISTAADMAHFLAAQLSDGRFRGTPLASPAAIAAMHTPPRQLDSHYAMGWFVQSEGGTRTIEHNGVLSTFYSEAVLLPESGYGFVLLANANGANSAFVGYGEIKRGLIGLLTGAAPTSGPVSVGGIGLLMGIVTLLGGGLALRSLLRVPVWARQARDQRWWRLLLGIVWLLVPGAALLALPALLVPLAGRSFGHAILARSMPDLFIWLALCGGLGALNAGIRLLLLGRAWSRRRAERAGKR